MKQLLLLVVMGMTTLITTAQTNYTFSENYHYKKYTWEDELLPYVPSEEEKDVPEIGLKDKRAIEIVLVENNAVAYILKHKQVYVNSEESIERNNRIYVPISFDGSIEKQMARVVKPNGDIIELDKDDIQEAKDETTENYYKYFALEGLEVGSTLEHISVTKIIPSLSGATYTYQDDFLKRDLSFELIYPSMLVMGLKSYNGFPEAVEDTTLKNKSYYKIEVDEIAPLEDEKYQNFQANLQAVSYKLTGSRYTDNYNLNGFTQFAQNVHDVVYKEAEKKELKAIDKLINAAGLEFARSDEDKIRKLETHVKKTIAYRENDPSDAFTVDEVLANGMGGDVAHMRLYALIFKKLGIKNEMVAGCNRYTAAFDPEFENMNHIRKFFFYFPKYDSYMAPSSFLYRYSLIPYQWTENYALFVKTSTLGGVDLGMGKVKYIECSPAEESVDSMYINIDFSNAIDTPKYSLYRSYTGHDAVNIQPLIDFIPSEEDKDELRESLVKQINENIEIEYIDTDNEGAAFFGKEPLILNCDFTGGSFLEKAGNNYLFKIGELIGPQVEMYENKDRVTDIEFSFAKVYLRQIEFEIPEGYEVKNLDKFNQDFEGKNEDGESIMAFQTSYEIVDNKVIVSNIEYYYEVKMDLQDHYKDFRDVVNAAADFNKIVLVLSPKN